MKVSGEYKLKDYFKYFFYIMFSRRSIPVFIIVALIFAFLYESLFVAYFCITWFLVIFIFVLLITYFRYKTMKKAAKLGLKFRSDITLGNEELKVEDFVGDAVFKFSDFRRLYCVKEFKNYFYVFIIRSQAIIIPKRFFNNKNDMQKFREKIVEYL